MFNLERYERIIVIFLISSLLLGLAVIAYQRSRPLIDVKIGHFTPDKASQDKDDPSPQQTTPLVNINTATAEDLMGLKGIGKTLSRRIVDYRSQNGPFRSSSEIKNVKGVGEALFNKIKDRIEAE